MALVVLGLLGGAPGATADDGHDDGPVSTLPPPPAGSVAIGDGLYVTGATVIPPDGGATRTMDAMQAAVFVQSWLPGAFFAGPDTAQEPPAELPVYRVDSTGQWWGGQRGTVTCYFATDGTTGYVAVSGPVVWIEGQEPPPPSNWYTPAPRVIEAFNGRGELIETAGVEQARKLAEQRNNPTPEASSDDGSTPVWVWVVAAAGALAVAGGGFRLLRRRAA